MDVLSIKYGWEGGASRFGPEIAVAFATFGLAAPVVTAIKARKAAAAKDLVRIDQAGAEPMKNGAAVTDAAEALA
jgi:hypothetical protein